MIAYAVSRMGVNREVNQDSMLCKLTPVGDLPDLFIVADGMGGYNGGDVASRYTIDNIQDYLINNTGGTLISTIKEAIAATNFGLRKKASEQPRLKGFGTTLVLATVIDNTLHVANIGDSRLYVNEDGHIRQITEDHSLVEAMVKKGELDRSEARFNPHKNMITRALGSEPSVEADFFEVELTAGSRILLCSDGVSNMMDDSIIENIMNDNKDPEKTCKVLIDTAKENGGRDDMTAVVINI